jgi:predicted RNase H-like nuclease (RuvC/YqgF family)
MSATKWTSRLLTAGATIALVFPLAGSAQSLSQVLTAEQQRTRLAQESQQRIDAVVADTGKQEEEYKRLLKEIEGLNIYNTLLQRQIDGQQARSAEITKAIADVDVISRQIVPAMTRMIESLDAFIDLDRPFLLEERKGRVAKLNELLSDPTVNDAEKFRKVTEAYQIENDYGRTIEAYTDDLEIDGENRQVEFLRIGRIALLYQTEDGASSGVWDQAARRWEDADVYRNEIREGLKIAKKQVAPDLILMPVSPPEAG